MRKENLCIDCGVVRNPKAKIGRCLDCKIAFTRAESIKRYSEQLSNMGYSFSEITWDRLKKIEVTNHACGHTFTAQLGNILNGCTVCSICGPEKRIKKALNGYMRLYGKDYNLLEKEDYTQLVRAKSGKNLRKKFGKDFKLEPGFHIDHIIPISFGFKNKLSVDVISDLSNLRIISAYDNGTKGAKIEDIDLLNKLTNSLHLVEDVTAELESFTKELINSLPLGSKVEALNNKIIINDNITLVIDSNNNGIKSNNEILIFEDEINDSRMRKKIVSLIRGKLGLNKKIFARKLSVVEIKSIDSTRFLDANHRQRSARAKVHLALVDDKKEIVAVMTFGKPRFNNNYEWEIIRYSSQLYTNVIGGASKLLSAFRKQFSPTSIISYADLRWGSGDVYEKIGFKFSHSTASNYWYEKDGKRIPRAKCQKHLLSTFLGEIYDDALTEQENMIRAGYKKVKDFGNNAFILDNLEKSGKVLQEA